jgi:hypothetical protein
MQDRDDANMIRKRAKRCLGVSNVVQHNEVVITQSICDARCMRHTAYRPFNTHHFRVNTALAEFTPPTPPSVRRENTPRVALQL